MTTEKVKKRDKIRIRFTVYSFRILLIHLFPLYYTTNPKENQQIFVNKHMLKKCALDERFPAVYNIGKLRDGEGKWEKQKSSKKKSL